MWLPTPPPVIATVGAAPFTFCCGNSGRSCANQRRQKVRAGSVLRVIPAAHQDDFKSVHRESFQHRFDSSEHSCGISCRERWIVKTTERVCNQNVLGSKAVAGKFELTQDDVLEFGGGTRWKN